MGGGMEAAAELTHGAVAAMSRPAAGGLRPVLQVVGAPAARGHGVVVRYRVLLSDGVHSQHATLQTSLNGLVTAGRLRDGSVVRVLDYICRNVYSQRVIIVIQLEVLQTECTLIGSPTIYQVNAAQPDIRSYSGSLSIHGSRAEQGVNSIALSPGQGLLHSSIAARAEHAVNPFYGSVLTQNAINAKMQQLSLNSHQGKWPAVPPIGWGFDRPDNTCGRPAQSLYQQPPAEYMNRGPIANNDSPSYVTPIAALNPYQGRWTIKGRVTAKTDIRHFGAGKVFSFDLLDAQGGEISAICFNSAVDQFSEQIVVGNVYLITGGSVKPTQKFNHLNSEHKVLLDTSSSIEICSSDDSDIPGQQYNFRQISEIQNLHEGDMVDLLGVVTSVNPPVTIMRKNGMETQKRTLQLKDMSGCSVEITLWGNVCNAEGQRLYSMCVSGFDPVLALKGGCVREFNGKFVNTISSSLLKVNPDLPDAERLMQWYITEGEFAVCTSLSQEISRISKTVAQIKEENLGRSDKPDWVTVEGAISHINTKSFSYPACTMELDGKRCNRKVTHNGDGSWHCSKCERSSQNCERRYLLQCQIQDHTGTTFATAFQEVGEEIIGLTAQELFAIKIVYEDDAQFTGIIQRACSQLYLFKLKIKEEIFGGEARVKVSIAKAERLGVTLKKNPSVPRASHILSEDGLGPRPVVGVTLKKSRSVPRASHILSEDGLGPRPVVSVRNCPVVMNMQKPAACGGFTASSWCYSDAGSGSCFKSNQSEHIPREFLRRATTYDVSSADTTSPGSRFCMKCDQPGHYFRDCPGLRNQPGHFDGLSSLR